MRLRKWRETKGVFLADLADEVGCSVSTLSLIERGLRTPKYSLTQRIVAATGGEVRAKDLHPAEAA